MVIAHQFEKKTPMTILETTLDNRSYQYAVLADSPLDDCLAALEQIKEHILQLKNKIESEKQEEPATQA